jgi:hypothetical protein
VSHLPQEGKDFEQNANIHAIVQTSGVQLPQVESVLKMQKDNISNHLGIGYGHDGDSFLIPGH